MSNRRPPLAEIDAAVLWAAWRAGQMERVLPWLLLLGGFCAVLAGLASFFWLTTWANPEDRLFLGLLIIPFALFLHRRLSEHPQIATQTVALLLGTAGVMFGAWLLVLQLAGGNFLVGGAGVALLCLLGTGLGLAGINRLAPKG